MRLEVRRPLTEPSGGTASFQWREIRHEIRIELILTPRRAEV
jgi:hypothetical protein